MATRPLPPGRRSRGGRAAPTVNLPDVKILSDVPATPGNATPTSSYVEQLRAQRERAPTATTASAMSVEPEEESSTTTPPGERELPAPVRSVKAFVSSLEKEAAVTVQHDRRTAAAGREAPSTAPVVEQPPAPFPSVAAPPVLPVETPIVARASSVVKPSLAAPPVQQTSVPSHPTQRVEAAPAPAPTPAPVPAPAPAPAPVSNGSPSVDEAVLEGFHPFKLLLPIYAVPEIPETVGCVFDDEALEMQKNIMKAIKKVFGKDRTKLEDFKINSRLYGNNFMDPLEYIESLVKDLGGNRALALVPCLVSIQNDFMKRSSMLVAARNYRVRNLANLEATLDKVDDVPASEPARAPSHHATAAVAAAAVDTAISATPTTNELVSHAAEAGVATTSNASTADEPSLVANSAEKVELGVTATVSASILENGASDDAHAPTKEAEEAGGSPLPQPHGVQPEASTNEVPSVQVVQTPLLPTPIAHEISEPVVSAVSAPAVVEAVLVEPTPLEPATRVLLVEEEPAEAAVSRVVEPSPLAPSEHAIVTDKEPVVAAEVVTPVAPPVTSTVVSGKLESAASFLTVDTTVSSERSSFLSSDSTATPPVTTSPLEHQPLRRKSTLNLFGEDIGDDDDDDDDEVYGSATTTTAKPPAAATAAPSEVGVLPAAATPAPAGSFFEAESLFGEPLSVTRKPTADPPAVHAAALKPPPPRSGMLFGFASAGADSDSDSDPEFSD